MITGDIIFDMNHSFLTKAGKIKVSDFTMLNELSTRLSIREVARVMRTTPAQISRRLRLIEKTLGYRVFDRGPKGLMIASTGQQALTLAQSMSEGFLSSINVRKQKQISFDKPLGIGGTAFLITHAAIPALGKLQKELPDLRSYVLGMGPDDLMSAGNKGAFQMALHPVALDWPRSWQSELIGTLSWGMFARKGHPYFRSKVALEEVPFVYPMMWDGTKLNVQNDFCPLPVNQRNSFVGTQTAEQAMHMVACSNVVAYIPRLLMKEDLNKGRVAEIEVPNWPVVERPVYMSFRSDEIRDLHYQKFKAEFQRILADAKS